MHCILDMTMAISNCSQPAALLEYDWLDLHCAFQRGSLAAIDTITCGSMLGVLVKLLFAWRVFATLQFATLQWQSSWLLEEATLLPVCLLWALQAGCDLWNVKLSIMVLLAGGPF